MIFPYIVYKSYGKAFALQQQIISIHNLHINEYLQMHTSAFVGVVWMTANHTD